MWNICGVVYLHLPTLDIHIRMKEFICDWRSDTEVNFVPFIFLVINLKRLETYACGFKIT